MTHAQTEQLKRYLYTAIRNLEGAKELLIIEEKELACNSSVSKSVNRMIDELTDILEKTN